MRDVEVEAEDKYLTDEVRKTQEQKEVREVTSHQPSAAKALHGAEHYISSSVRSLKHQGLRLRAMLLAIINTIIFFSKNQLHLWKIN